MEEIKMSKDNYLAGFNKNQILNILKYAWRCSTLVKPYDMYIYYDVEFEPDFTTLLKDLILTIENNETLSPNDDYFYSKVLNNIGE